MNRKHIGRVAVDSGQLLLIDPLYVEHKWKKQHESNVVGVKFWGSGLEKAIISLKSKGFNVEIKTTYGYIPIDSETTYDVIIKGLRDISQADSKNLLLWDTVNDGSLQEVSELTMNSNLAGTFRNTLGVAFQSGFGDGIYDVYATYDEFGNEKYKDNRITKVEIILIE